MHTNSTTRKTATACRAFKRRETHGGAPPTGSACCTAPPRPQSRRPRRAGSSRFCSFNPRGTPARQPRTGLRRRRARARRPHQHHEQHRCAKEERHEELERGETCMARGCQWSRDHHEEKHQHEEEVLHGRTRHSARPRLGHTRHRHQKSREPPRPHAQRLETKWLLSQNGLSQNGYKNKNWIQELD